MKKLSQTEVFNNGWWSVLQTHWLDKKGNTGDVVTMKSAKSESGDSVFVLPVTPDGDIVYIKEFRYNSEDYEFQFVAGGIEANHSPLETAQHELREESGYTAKEFIYLGEYFTNGYIKGVSKLYLALGCEKSGDQETHELEDIEVFTGSPKELGDMVEQNVIRCPWSTLAYKLAVEKTNNFTKLDI